MPTVGPLALIVSLACAVVGQPGGPSSPAGNTAINEPTPILEIPAAPAVVVAPVPAKPAPPPEPAALWATLSVVALAPSVFHVRAGGSTRTGAGLAFLALTGRGWSLPAAGAPGLLTRFGGALSAVEGTLDKTANAFVWPIEGQASTGPRIPLAGSKYLYALVGIDGLLRMTGRNDTGAQRRRAYLHVPEISLGLQSKTRDTLWEVGPLAGLAVVGHDSARFRSDLPLAGADTYTLRPYAGALASFAAEATTLTLNAHRALLGSSAFDDRLHALACHSFTEARHGSGLGGCLSTDLVHARAPGESGPTLWSYEVSFRVGGVIVER